MRFFSGKNSFVSNFEFDFFIGGINTSHSIDHHSRQNYYLIIKYYDATSIKIVS